MIVDIILIIVAVVSLASLLRILIRKMPHIANINLRTMPESKQETIKRQILEDKLKRDLKKRWHTFRDLFVIERKKTIVDFFSKNYQRLKDLDQEYRLAGKKDLSSHVSQAKSIDERIALARQQIIDEEYDRAEQTLLECLKLDEHSVKVYTVLAQVYKERGNYDHARQTLEYVLRLTNSEDASVFSSLAHLSRERGDLHAAQEEYSKSISLDPNNHNYYMELAEVYTVLGDHANAREAAQKSLMLAPNNPKILDFLIENSIILQDKNRASEHLTKLIEVNPQNGKIVSFKERIGSLGQKTI